MDSPRRNDEPIALRPREAARLLNISERTLWQLTRDRKVPAARVGKLWRYSREELQRWLAERQEGGGHDRQ